MKWTIQEKPENNERIRNNGNFIADKETDAGGGRETGNLFGVALEYFDDHMTALLEYIDL